MGYIISLVKTIHLKQTSFKKMSHTHYDTADKIRCREIYWTLLHFAKHNSTALPTHFIRELEQTQRCDAVCKDFSTVRNSYKSRIGDECYDKIMNQTKRDEDLEYLAFRTLNEYAHWTQKELVSGLPWRSQLYYYTVERVENILSTIRIFSTGRGTPKGVVGPRKVIENYKNREKYKN